MNSTPRSRSAACLTHSARGSTRFRPRSPISQPSRALREMWAGASAPPASRSASYGKATPIRRRIAPVRCRFAALAPLAEVAGVRLISLQKGVGEEQLSLLPPSMRVETLGADFDAGPDAFVDTAAAMTCTRSHRHLRHLDRPSGGGSGRAGLGRVEERRGMALVDRTRRFALVPDDAPLSSVAAGRLARRVRRHGARSSPRSPRAAPRRA